MDWGTPDQMVSQYFSVQEALWLHHWGRLATEEDGLTEEVKQNLFTLCALLDKIRDYLTHPMNVTSMYRSQVYNHILGINPTADVHNMGMAVDFTCPGLTVKEVQDKLRPVLETYGIRMEKGTDTWVHLDIHPVIHNREFSV